MHHERAKKFIQNSGDQKSDEVGGLSEQFV